MPLDGHSYLVAQGWSGTGTGLRTGAISRPLAIPQKKNLAGLGKDRDEAFPFWDHLFAAAASAIKIKATDSDEDSDAGSAEESTPAAPVLKRTSTGIFSNRRPVVGTPASSGTCTPDAALASTSGSATSRLSLMAIAKRQAAQRGLYSRFFRGPVLGPDDVEGEMVMSEIKAEKVVVEVTELACGLVKKGKGKAVDEEIGPGEGQVDENKKKRKAGKVESEEDEEKERKRRKKELKEAEKRERRERKREKKAKKAAAADVLGHGAQKEKKKKKSRDDGDSEGREARKSKKSERVIEELPVLVYAASPSSLDTEDEPRLKKRKKQTGEESAIAQDTSKESKKKREREKHESS